MESTRQKKIGVTLQKDLTIILQKLLKEGAMGSIIASVTKVRVSPDLSSAKVYISIFPVPLQSFFPGDNTVILLLEVEEEG